MNRYYIVAMNSQSQTYITGEFRINGLIETLEDVNMARDILLDEFNIKDNKNWFILNWKKFEVED